MPTLHMAHTISLLSMSKKNLDRYDIVRRLLRKEINGTGAARLLNLSVRQVRRLKAGIKTRGPKALIHGLKDRPSNRRLPDERRTTIVSLLNDTYPDFGPTFAAEKLREDHEIDHDPKTIRAIQITEGLWKPRRGTTKSVHRTWRQRRSAFGEMEQFDGSYHDWFEGRGGISASCLLAAIDDATGKIVEAVFAPHEGVFPVFAFWRAYCETHGTPRSIYLDKFSTYRMNSAIAKENPDLKTQFGRAMEALGIEPIFAHSPQAKGRVERLFDTLQDRLVKELRLRKIGTIEEANRFLREEFIPTFNAKFSVEPASGADLHRVLTASERALLPSIFSRHERRTVQNDFTFSFQRRWHQLTASQPATVCRKDEVTIEEHLDGSIHVRLRGRDLNFAILPERPKKMQMPVMIAKTSAIQKPAADHPWRRRFHASVLKVQCAH